MRHTLGNLPDRLETVAVKNTRTVPFTPRTGMCQAVWHPRRPYLAVLKDAAGGASYMLDARCDELVRIKKKQVKIKTVEKKSELNFFKFFSFFPHNFFSPTSPSQERLGPSGGEFLCFAPEGSPGDASFWMYGVFERSCVKACVNVWDGQWVEDRTNFRSMTAR